MANRKPYKKPKCLHCDNKAQSRGVCWPCGGLINLEVSAGKMTDEEAVERGLWLPKKKNGRKPSGLLAKLAGKLKRRAAQ